MIKRFFHLIERLKKSFIKGEFHPDLKALEEILSYSFKDRDLITGALTHRSYAFAQHENMLKSNERLEFLGDAVLQIVISENLFRAFPNFREGELTKIRSRIVSKINLAATAERIGINRFILLSESEEVSGGRGRASILEDTYEAIIGALYLDGGMQPAEEFIEATLLLDMNGEEGIPEDRNFKSILLEWVQSQKMAFPIYKTFSEKGPDHDKIFTVEVYVQGRSIGRGSGRSKKEAQQEAACDALRQKDYLNQESLSGAFHK